MSRVEEDKFNLTGANGENRDSLQRKLCFLCYLLLTTHKARSVPGVVAVTSYIQTV